MSPLLIGIGAAVLTLAAGAALVAWRERRRSLKMIAEADAKLTATAATLQGMQGRYREVMQRRQAELVNSPAGFLAMFGPPARQLTEDELMAFLAPVFRRTGNERIYLAECQCPLCKPPAEPICGPSSPALEDLAEHLRQRGMLP